jgi:zinc protease
MASVSLSALKPELDASLDLYADVILNPAFPQSDFDRMKQERLIQIQQEKVQPVAIALRVFPGLLYGSDHAYGLPLTGSGTEASVENIERADLVDFHETWFKPNNATLIVVGDATMDEIKPKLEGLFSDWKKGKTPEKNIGTVAQKAAPSVYVIDRPGSEQSIIFAGHVAPPKANPDEIAIETMNTLLGGAFVSRINMNLREDKGWSYGAFTLLFDARGQRPFIAYAPVQTDKTSESMQEVLNELRGILGDNPVTTDEVLRAKQNLTLTLPGQWETIGAVMASIVEMVQFGLPEDHITTYADRVNALDEAQVSAAAESVVKPDHLVWVIVGDREQIEAGIRGLNIGEIQYLDANGNPVEGGTH